MLLGTISKEVNSSPQHIIEAGLPGAEEPSLGWWVANKSDQMLQIIGKEWEVYTSKASRSCNLLVVTCSNSDASESGWSWSGSDPSL